MVRVLNLKVINCPYENYPVIISISLVYIGDKLFIEKYFNYLTHTNIL